MSSIKRQRDVFDSDEEALIYASRDLPKDIWLKIIVGSPDLTFGDINRLCRVNTRISDLCREGLIWRGIFVRLFGRELLLEIESDPWYDSHGLSKSQRLYYILRTQRVYEMHKNGAYWTLKKKGKIFPDIVSLTNRRSDILELLATGTPEFISALKTMVNANLTWDSPFRCEWRFPSLKRNPELERRIIFFSLLNGYRQDIWLEGKESIGCAVCGKKEALKQCPCGHALYCDTSCQKKDWVIHSSQSFHSIH